MSGVLFKFHLIHIFMWVLIFINQCFLLLLDKNLYFKLTIVNKKYLTV